MFPSPPPPPPPPANAAAGTHSPEITIRVESAGWDASLHRAFTDRNYVMILVKGYKAGRIKSRVVTVTRVPAPPAPFAPTPLPTIVDAARAEGLAMLATELLYAAGRGYSSFKLLFNARGAGTSDDELSISVR